MSDYIYQSRFSFLARCWWQLSDGFIDPAQWADASGQLTPIWVEFDSGGNWDRYLRAEPEGELTKHLAPHDYVRSEHRYCELFWFGAYTQGAYEPGARFYYEIRPYDRVWTPYNWILGYNAHPWSGYLGFWRPDQQAGVDRDACGEQLWRLGSLDAQNLKKGEVHCNLELLTPQGRLVRRYKTDGVGVMNTISGQRSLISLEVLNVPHEAFRP